MPAKRKPNLPAIIAHNLKRLREKRGLSQQDLADLAKVQQGTVSAIENQIRSPSMTMIAALAHALGVSGAELFREVK
jgi:transcriptional regulator with XRE-family HTH domain